MTTILVIEDNQALATGLRSNLEFEGYHVNVAADGASGQRLWEAGPPDLVLLDLMLPDTDGYRLLRDMREAGSQVPVLILTALGEETDKVRGFRFGADDYVTKPFGLMELLARVDALIRRVQRSSGRGTDPMAPITCAGVTIEPATHTVRRDGVLVPLRPKEFDLLLALARRRGQVASRGELLREVWGYDDSVMSRTVDTHVAELRRKLEGDPASPDLILTVLKSGYRLRWDPSVPA